MSYLAGALATGLIMFFLWPQAWKEILIAIVATAIIGFAIKKFADLSE